MIWYESDNPNGYVTGKKFSIDLPCVTVMAAGMGGGGILWGTGICVGVGLMLGLRHNSPINPRHNGMNLEAEPCPTSRHIAFR